jgi:hypothetical protein
MLPCELLEGQSPLLQKESDNMEFRTHNDSDDLNRVWGTALQGTFDLDYEDIVEVFGEPDTGDGYKVDAEWYILFENGAVATIYNYKDGPNYLGEDAGKWEDSWADIKDKNRDWHVGGLDGRALIHVREALGI